MKRQILILGVIGGALFTLLKWSEYQFLVLNHSLEIYGALTAITFAAVGLGLGFKLSRRPQPAIASPVPSPALAVPFSPDPARREALGITPRELEILALVAQGLSNREIATQLFVSENTVKTHCSRAFDKIGARRRTQAVLLGKELGILP